MKKYKIDPILFEKILQKNQDYLKVSEENKITAKKWIDIAEDDIEVVKILRNTQHYAAAIYHLQQAFEKLTKGYYILSGRLSPEQAWGHKFILEKLKKEIQNEDITDFVKLNSSMNGTNIDLTSAQSLLDTIGNSEESLRSADIKTVAGLIQFIEQIGEKLKSKETLENLEKTTTEKGFLNLLKHLILKITHFRVRNSEVKAAIEQHKLIDYVQSIVISIKLHYLGLITFSHWNSPRYPSERVDNIDFFDYTEDLGIVKSLPEIITLFDEIKQDIQKKAQKSKKEESTK